MPRNDGQARKRREKHGIEGLLLLATESWTKGEWVPLYIKSNKGRSVPETAPSIEEAVSWLARLGGYLGRKSDGPPGMIAI